MEQQVKDNDRQYKLLKKTLPKAKKELRRVRHEAKEASRDVDNMEKITTNLVAKQPTLKVLDLLQQQQTTAASAQPALNPEFNSLYPALTLPAYDETCESSPKSETTRRRSASCPRPCSTEEPLFTIRPGLDRQEVICSYPTRRGTDYHPSHLGGDGPQYTSTPRPPYGPNRRVRIANNGSQGGQAEPPPLSNTFPNIPRPPPRSDSITDNTIPTVPPPPPLDLDAEIARLKELTFDPSNSRNDTSNNLYKAQDTLAELRKAIAKGLADAQSNKKRPAHDDGDNTLSTWLNSGKTTKPKPPVKPVQINIPPKTEPMKLQHMLQLMPTPGDQNLLKWMGKAMALIPHKDGTQPVDRILANALQQKLKEAGRKEDADAISAEFMDDTTKWKDILERLALMYPKSEMDNTVTIDKFNREYLWHKMGPMNATMKCLREMEIPMSQAPKDDSDGKRLFRILRSKIPTGLRPGLQGMESSPWGKTLDYLQRHWNSEKGDQQAAGALKPQNNTYPDDTPKTFAAPAQPLYSPPNPPPIHVTVNSPPLPAPAPVFVTTPAPNHEPNQRYNMRRRNNNNSANQHSAQPRPLSPRPARREQRNPQGPRRNNGPPPRSGSDNRQRARSLPPRDKGLRSGAPRQQRERATPSSSEEAHKIAQQQGRDYDFWTKSNIFAPLGLYLNPETGESPQCCYICRLRGHLTRHCIASAILKINNQVLSKVYRKDANGVPIKDGKGNFITTGYEVRERYRKIDSDVQQDTRNRWHSFLNGGNKLGIRLRTIPELNAYLTSQGCPPIEKCNELADRYFLRPRDLNKEPAWQPPVFRASSQPPPATSAAYSATYWENPVYQQAYDRSLNI